MSIFIKKKSRSDLVVKDVAKGKKADNDDEPLSLKGLFGRLLVLIQNQIFAVINP